MKKTLTIILAMAAAGGFASGQSLDGRLGMNLYGEGDISNLRILNIGSLTHNTSNESNWYNANSFLLQGFVVPAGQLTGVGPDGQDINLIDLMPLTVRSVSIADGPSETGAPTAYPVLIDRDGIVAPQVDVTGKITANRVEADTLYAQTDIYSPGRIFSGSRIDAPQIIAHNEIFTNQVNANVRVRSNVFNTITRDGVPGVVNADNIALRDDATNSLKHLDIINDVLYVNGKPINSITNINTHTLGYIPDPTATAEDAPQTFTYGSKTFDKYFKTHSYDGRSYAVYTVPGDSVGWATARAAAQELGGYLATLTTHAEYRQVSSLLIDGMVVNLWIGLYREDDRGLGSGDFVWITGEKSVPQVMGDGRVVPFHAWMGEGDQPNGSGNFVATWSESGNVGAEGRLFGPDRQHAWNDTTYADDSVVGFIVEFEQ